jgi:hypothetical protein
VVENLPGNYKAFSYSSSTKKGILTRKRRKEVWKKMVTKIYLVAYDFRRKASK